MKSFWALIRKQIHESRWTLFVSAAVLFGLGWLSVYMTSLNETRILKMLATGRRRGPRSTGCDAWGSRRSRPRPRS